MASDRDEATAYCGFRTNADDTPREPATEWEPPEEDDGPGPVSWPKVAAATGVAMGLLAAVAVGWSAMRKPEPEQAPQAAAAAVEPRAPPLQVVVTDPPPPPPVPKAKERLEVLPKGEIVAARPAYAPLAQAVIPGARAPGVAVAAREPDPPPRTPPSAGESARETNAVAAAPPPRRFDACDDAPTRAMTLVCRDLELAEADRRMKRAYRAALAAGVPEHVLAEDQADWLEVREDAAHVSRRAVADIYSQRTRELRAMADDRRY